MDMEERGAAMMRLDEKGSSMVSVIVAFVLLLMGLAMFTTVLFAASDLVKTTEDNRRMVDSAMETYYLDESLVGDEMFNVIQLKDEDGTGIKVPGAAYKAEVGGYAVYYFE